MMELDVGGCARLTDVGVGLIAFFAPQLRVLNMSTCSRVSSTSLFLIAQSCRQLQSLSIYGWLDKETGRTTDALMKMPSTLTSLDLGAWPATNYNIEAILSSLPQLSRLRLPNSRDGECLNGDRLMTYWRGVCSQNTNAKHPGIEAFYRWPPMAPSSVERMAQCPSCTFLKHLEINGGLCVQPYTHALLLLCRRLVHLESMEWACVTIEDALLQALTELDCVPQLQKMEWSKVTLVSCDASHWIQRIRAARPRMIWKGYFIWNTKMHTLGDVYKV
jgi:hypothetical protein